MYDGEPATTLAEAAQHVGHLAGTPSDLSYLFVFIQPFQIREAIASSQIELSLDGVRAQIQ